jgi:hypothetical protein
MHYLQMSKGIKRGAAGEKQYFFAEPPNQECLIFHISFFVIAQISEVL